MEFYVIISWYSDGSGKPEVNFSSTADGAILITAQMAEHKKVTVYKVTDEGSTLVTGQELRTVGETNKKGE